MPPEFLAAICRTLGEDHQRVLVRPISGGDINTAVELRFPGESVFVKYGGVDAQGFAAECEGLEALTSINSGLMIPRPIAHGELLGRGFLAMELLELTPKSVRSDAALGQGLARLHGHHQSYFGWHRDNRIGATPQPNPATQDWVQFFLQHRLRHQALLLRDRAIEDGIEAIGEVIEPLFDGYIPYPSLLHGDLWGGNYAACGDQAVIYDPACYHGCRETDLAMTELFGGFGPGFYAAYNATAPLHQGYPLRRPLYQLYHVLNHANLFGGAYLPQARQRIAQILASVSGPDG